MNFVTDPDQTQTQKFMDIEFSTIISLDEINGLSTPTNKIRRLCMVPIVFGEATVVGMSEAKSYYDYNYKTGFQIWK